MRKIEEKLFEEERQFEEGQRSYWWSHFLKMIKNRARTQAREKFFFLNEAPHSPNVAPPLAVPLWWWLSATSSYENLWIFFFFSNFYTGRFFIFWPKWLVSPNTFGIDKYQPVYKVVRNKKVFVLVHQPIRNIPARIRILSISLWNGEAPVYGKNFFLKWSTLKIERRHLKC